MQMHSPENTSTSQPSQRYLLDFLQRKVVLSHTCGALEIDLEANVHLTDVYPIIFVYAYVCITDVFPTELGMATVQARCGTNLECSWRQYGLMRSGNAV